MPPAKSSSSSSIGTDRTSGRDTIPAAVEENVLRFVGTGEVEADRVVALPRIEGLRLPGVPHDANGFVPIDEHGRVRDVDDVYAAGDLTNFPIKQGGLAAQQADAAAEAIAAAAGAEITPTPFKPVLRGLLLTGLSSPLHARRGRQPGITARHGASLVAAREDRRPATWRRSSPPS